MAAPAGAATPLLTPRADARERMYQRALQFAAHLIAALLEDVLARIGHTGWAATVGATFRAYGARAHGRMGEDARAFLGLF